MCNTPFRISLLHAAISGIPLVALLAIGPGCADSAGPQEGAAADSSGPHEASAVYEGALAAPTEEDVGVGSDIGPRPARVPPIMRLDTVFLPPAKFKLYSLVALGQTRLQMSHTGEGVPLVIRKTPFFTTTVMSYIDFSPELNSAGVADRALDIPIVQQGIGNLAMAAIGALSGGHLTAYEVRFQLNNLYTRIDSSTFEASLEEGAFIYTLEFSSGNPTIKCEANALSFVPLGFPIPIGWSDPLCPDANLRNPQVRLRFVPALDGNGAITIRDVSVSFDGNIDVSPIDFLDECLKFKKRIKEGFESQFRSALLSAEFRSVLATNLKVMLEREHRQPIARFKSLQIDSSGILAIL